MTFTAHFYKIGKALTEVLIEMGQIFKKMKNALMCQLREDALVLDKWIRQHKSLDELLYFRHDPLRLTIFIMMLWFIFLFLATVISIFVE